MIQTLYGVAENSASWLRRVAHHIESERPRLDSCDDVHELLAPSQPHSAAVTYLSYLKHRGFECLIGNFEFWSWDRVCSEGRTWPCDGMDLLVFADWMLDSEYCALDLQADRLVFVGGDEPRIGTMGLAEYLSRVVGDPSFPHGMT